MIPPTVTVEWNLDFALPTALLDPDRLNQVFCNIINNAIQAMPSNGKLKISTRHVLEPGGEASEAREWLEVSIEDNGTGIEPVHLTKIFEPLFTTKARGTGLGLAISKNIIEKHGGVILVTSQVGKGTCFIVKLPMKPPPDKGDEL
jgi:signal transduction histidine kinase